MPVVTASIKDIPALVALLNSAYRGEASKQGWTTEADMIGGERRTDETVLNTLFQIPGSTFLKYEDERGLIGCVNLQKKGDRLYLGMLSVSPAIQAKGIGKQLMAAATEHARETRCQSIYMNVISIRHELVAWYERQGYRKTGEILPFPDDPRFGVPTQPVEFIVMEKQV